MAKHPATTPEEYRELISLDPTKRPAPIITSAEGWQAYVSNVGDSSHPLRGVPMEAIRDFSDSLKFTSGGLAHGDVGRLVDIMSFTQFCNLLSDFGFSLEYFLTIRHSNCQGTASGDNGCVKTDDDRFCNTPACDL